MSFQHEGVATFQYIFFFGNLSILTTYSWMFNWLSSLIVFLVRENYQWVFMVVEFIWRKLLFHWTIDMLKFWCKKILIFILSYLLMIVFTMLIYFTIFLFIKLSVYRILLVIIFFVDIMYLNINHYPFKLTATSQSCIFNYYFSCYFQIDCHLTVLGWQCMYIVFIIYLFSIKKCIPQFYSNLTFQSLLFLNFIEWWLLINMYFMKSWKSHIS